MPTMVKPKATRSLWPTATPGRAGSPAPITFQPGRDQVDQVAQAGQGERPVRVVGEQGLAGGGERAVDHPVVAAVLGMLAAGLGLETERRAGGVGEREELLVDPFEAGPRLGFERARRRGGNHLVGELPAERGAELRAQHLHRGVARHPEAGHAGEADLGRPRLGAEAGELELDRRPVAARRR